MGGIFDNLRDAIVGGIEDVAQNIADFMTAWATAGIRVLLQILQSDLIPSTRDLLTGPISVLLGATFGLAGMIVRLFVVIAVMVTLIAVLRRRRTEFMSRTVSSVVWLLLFALVFPPVYSLIVAGIRDVGIAALSLASRSSDRTANSLADTIVGAFRQDNIALQFIVGLINGFFSSLAITEIVSMVIGFIVLLAFYPLSVVFRPFGTFGLNQFRLMTAGVVSIPLSLLLIPFMLAFQLMIMRGAETYLPFLSGLVDIVCSLIFGAVIVAVPIVVFALAYNKVTETVGSMDAKFQSGIDVATMPDINSRQIGQDATRDKVSYIKQFATELPGAIAAGENDAGTEAKELAKQIALQAASKSGNPVVMAAGAAYTGIQIIRKSKGSNEANQGDN